MIITKQYANKLVKDGKATVEECTAHIDGNYYRVVTRHDLRRIDHFKVA